MWNAGFGETELPETNGRSWAVSCRPRRRRRTNARSRRDPYSLERGKRVGAVKGRLSGFANKAPEWR
jgi:hypothetical protein